MAVRLAINPITWSNDDMLELGGDIPLEVCLAEARQAGYCGIELGGKFPRSAVELKPILQRHELVLVSGWYDGRIRDLEVAEEFDRVMPHLKLLKDMGCRYVVYADVSGGTHGSLSAPISTRPRLSADQWKPYGRKTTQLADRMADFGVRMAFHHHMGTVVESDDDVDRLMSNSGEAVGLLYDTGHSAFSGGDPLQLVRRHVKRVVHVHCKDARPQVLKRARAEDMSFMGAVLKGVFTVPGDGFIDYRPILAELAGANYSGWLVVEAEQDPKIAHPLTYARMGFDFLARSAREAGFSVLDR